MKTANNETIPIPSIRAAHAALTRSQSTYQAVQVGVDAARQAAGTRRLAGATALAHALGDLAEEWRRKREGRAANRPYPDAPLRARAEATVCAAAATAWNRCGYRESESRWAGGGHRVEVRIGEPAASGESETVWSANGKWQGRDSRHRLRVPLRWRRDVAARGVAVVDGLFTLDAAPVDPGTLLPGEEALTAQWVEQGRGFAVKVVRGLLFRSSDTAGEWMHAPSLTYARRTAAQRFLAAQMERAERASERRARLLARISCRPVVAADIRALGACDAGIRNWCARHGVNPESAVPLAALAKDPVAAPYALRMARRLVAEARAAA